ncbi:hypothetical protein D3C73_337530 [compost metagenome]
MGSGYYLSANPEWHGLSEPDNGCLLKENMGHHVHSDLRTDNVVQALKETLKQRKTTQPLIHHSDRGIQYCSASYQSIHERHGLICSI